MGSTGLDGFHSIIGFFFPRISSPLSFFVFVFAFFGFPLFSMNQAKMICFCWGPNSSQVL